MRTGRPIPPLTITHEERETLERWARRPTTGQAVAQRARLILSCATGRTNTRVAHDLRVTKQTVGKWRTRFLDLFDRQSNRTGSAIIDEKTGRVDLYDTKSNRTGYGTIDKGGRIDLFDTRSNRVGSGQVAPGGSRGKR